MALATSVSGVGIRLSGGKETGIMQFQFSAIDNATDSDPFGDDKVVNYSTTINYTDERKETKWIGLTLQACLDYITAHPNSNVSYSMSNQRIGSYELVVSENTRTINSAVTVKLSEPA